MYNPQLIKNHHLKESFNKLKEYYEKYDFEIIRNFFNELYENPNSLEEIEDKYNIMIAQKDGNSFITGAAYLPDLKKYVLYLHNNAIESIEKNQNKNEIIKQAEFAMIHEYTHEQQNQGKFWELLQKRLIRGENDYYKYISQQHEIDAFAASIAEEALRRNKDKNNILKKISLNDFSDLKNENYYLLNDYKKIGGKIWKRLLNEIYRYIKEPEQQSELYKKIKNRVVEEKYV